MRIDSKLRITATAITAVVLALVSLAGCGSETVTTQPDTGTSSSTVRDSQTGSRAQVLLFTQPG